MNASAGRQFSLSLIDYVIFAAFMCISVGVGFYYAVIGRFRKRVQNVKTKTDDYLMGGRKLPYLPVTMSLLTTFLSGKAILGTPAEIFDHGALWFLHYAVSIIAFLISGFIFVPIFFHLSTVSIYEYLELRFHSVLVRKLCAVVFILNNLVYMGVVVYGPAVALNSVTDLPTYSAIILVGVSSTLYTTIGGLKAVVWTDTLQAGVMFAGMLVVTVKGTFDVGGLSRIWEVAVVSGRAEQLLRFNPNPAQYMTVWTSTLGAICIWLSLYGVNQMAVQRYCSVPTLKDAQKVVFLTIPLYFLLSMMVCYIGLLVLAYFYNCNPLETGELNTYDQLMVLFAARVAGKRLPRLSRPTPSLHLCCHLVYRILRIQQPSSGDLQRFCEAEFWRKSIFTSQQGHSLRIGSLEHADCFFCPTSWRHCKIFRGNIRSNKRPCCGSVLPWRFCQKSVYKSDRNQLCWVYWILPVFVDLFGD
ncbi:hypothetical protein L596_010424 [Steinernema carpocapsae]|uniref:Sodium/solute symporter n=1 Tax=Steinernema carpocapsae TaxID=34508 RepID=A0A4U5PIV5_STECR|nr:hypothetical protein L596_010424 [Steinernema carpocapsae]